MSKINQAIDTLKQTESFLEGQLESLKVEIESAKAQLREVLDIEERASLTHRRDEAFRRVEEIRDVRLPDVQSLIRKFNEDGWDGSCTTDDCPDSALERLIRGIATTLCPECAHQHDVNRRVALHYPLPAVAAA